MSKPYTLQSPCKDCPFRTDVPSYLAPERAQEIMEGSCEESNFYCHKTIDYSDDGEGQVTGKSRVCAGFLITMEKEGRANQPTRIAEGLGLYDRTQLGMDAPTHDSMWDWVKSYAPESDKTDDSSDYCNIVAPGCENPAGFARGGEPYSNPLPPACADQCTSCGEPVCPACTDRWESLAVGGDEVSVPVCVECA